MEMAGYEELLAWEGVKSSLTLFKSVDSNKRTSPTSYYIWGKLLYLSAFCIPMQLIIDAQT